MTCQETRALLMTYLDSELDARSTAEVGEHLAACEACNARFAAEEKLERRTRDALSQESMPEAAWGRLQARLNRNPRVGWRWVAVAASLLLVAGLAFRAWQKPQPSGLLGQMISVHQDFLAHRIRPEIESSSPEPLEKFLAGHVEGSFRVPRGGSLMGHSVTLIGARRETFQGRPAADILLSCCGFPASVFVMDRSSFEEAPGMRQALGSGGVLTLSGPGGLKAKAAVRGDLVISVVSAHDTPVTEAVQALAEAILEHPPVLLAEAP